jgi:hypothetical protein
MVMSMEDTMADHMMEEFYSSIISSFFNHKAFLLIISSYCIG